MMASLQTSFPGQVELFVQDGLGDEVDPAGFRVVDTGRRLSRLRRMSLGGWRMTLAVIGARPKIAHFHDPELLPWALMLRLCGIKVVYDVHEDYPEAVAQNYRLPQWARKALPQVVRAVEWVGGRLLSAIVAVTPQIASRFPPSKTVMVRNWPKIDEFHTPSNRPMGERPKEFAYIGTITLNRNILGMLDAFELVKDTGAVFRLAGDFTVAGDKVQATAHPGWDRVRFDGWVSRDGVADILCSARAGLVVLQPVERFKLAYPIKLFEYMAAGLPVIASDFPLWREIVEDAACGLLVNPLDPKEIAAAIRWIIENPDEAQAMGARGREAVLEKYNWAEEADELVRLYERLGVESARAAATGMKGN